MMKGGRPTNFQGGKRQGPKRIGHSKPPPGVPSKLQALQPAKKGLVGKKAKKAAATAAAWALLHTTKKPSSKGGEPPKRFVALPKAKFAH